MRGEGVKTRCDDVAHLGGFVPKYWGQRFDM